MAKSPMASLPKIPKATAKIPVMPGFKTKLTVKPKGMAKKGC